ncbi:TauD/TfdA family dioxygenase [Streptomyces sp. NA04227]|uniref:TauD/TfdA family dioxygenase n=1 Tax=Streptomyces sp. NA04227 TaxID=2742136 RepID=UPI0015914B95|nr:TauD/TfdA family dioxygenase [Streptomyces sp. NA04227]QKW09785.1 TauD/TfdA family dioxygenase [Streptomyces sp. NA04227]
MSGKTLGDISRELSYSDIRDVVELTGPERERVRGECLAVADRFAVHDLHDDALIYAAEDLARRLPSRVVQSIRGIRDRSTVDGVLVIEGLPVDQGVATPHGPRDEPGWTTVPVASLVQLSIMTMLGAPISYAEEKSGRLIQDVYPKAGFEERQENSGSVLLELHTEDGFLLSPPDYVSLLCMRPDHEGRAATVGCGIRRVLSTLPAEIRTVLRQPRFKLFFSSSFTVDNATRWTHPVPVLRGPEDDPDLCVDLHGMIGVDETAVLALDRLRRALEDNLLGGVLQAGSLLIVDNNAAVHGRTGFVPRYDGSDRWLRRCFVTKDLRRVRGDIVQGRMLRSRERSSHG